MDRDTDQEVERENVVPNEVIPETQDIVVENKNETVNEIGTNFEGAPEQVRSAITFKMNE